MLRYAHLLTLTVVLWVFLPPAQAQTYRVYRPVPRFFPSVSAPENPYALHWELSPTISLGPIKDYTGERIAFGMAGVRTGFFMRLAERVAVGIEGEISHAVGGDCPLLTPMTRRSASGVFKWTVTENTHPKMYLSAAVGAVCHDSRLKFSRYDFKQCGSLFSVGAGYEWELSSRLYVQTQYRLSYEPSPWETFLFSAPKLYGELSAGVQWRF